MIKIDRITIRVRGDGNTLNHHQHVRLARAVGESLAGAAADRNVTIDRIGFVHQSPPTIQPTALAGGISRRILARVRKR